MPVHHRTITDRKDGTVYHFASTDGKVWLEVDHKPDQGDEDAIDALFEGNGRTKPMSILSRWFSFGVGDWAEASQVEVL